MINGKINSKVRLMLLRTGAKITLVNKKLISSNKTYKKQVTF